MSPNVSGTGRRSSSMDTAMLRRRRHEIMDDHPRAPRLPAVADGGRESHEEHQLIGQEVVRASQAVTLATPDRRFETPRRPVNVVEEMGLPLPGPPRSHTPLFSEQQAADMEALQNSTSLLRSFKATRMTGLEAMDGVYAEDAPDSRELRMFVMGGYPSHTPAEAAQPETRDTGRISIDEHRGVATEDAPHSRQR